MRAKIADSRAREARERFVKSIRESDILRLTSAHRNGDLCTFFQPLVCGPYNVCYFVRFGSGGGKSTNEPGGGTGLAESAAGDVRDGSTEGCEKDREDDLCVVRVPLDPVSLHPCLRKG